MIDPTKLPEAVSDALTERGHTTEQIAAMTPERAFEEYCNWNGLFDWAHELTIALDGVRAANQ